MLPLVKPGLAAALTGLLMALVGEWVVVAGAFTPDRDLQPLLVGCVLDVVGTAALALTVSGVVRGARPDGLSPGRPVGGAAGAD